MLTRAHGVRVAVAVVLGLLAGPSAADIDLQSQFRGVGGTSYARVGSDGLYDQDQITTDSGTLFNRDIVVSAINGDAEASSGAVQNTSILPLSLDGLLAANGIGLTRVPDAFGEGRGEAWFYVDFALSESHSVDISVIIDNAILDGDDLWVNASFALLQGGSPVFEVSSVGEHQFAGILAPGEYQIRAETITTARSADGEGLAVANIRERFDVQLTVIPGPAVALPLAAGLLLRSRRRPCSR